MKSKLKPRLAAADWKNFCDRFHFSSVELPLIQAIYKALLPLVDACAYYSCLLYTSNITCILRIFYIRICQAIVGIIVLKQCLFNNFLFIFYALLLKKGLHFYTSISLSLFRNYILDVLHIKKVSYFKIFCKKMWHHSLYCSATEAFPISAENRRLFYLLTVNFPHHPHRNLHPDQTLLHDS